VDKTKSKRDESTPKSTQDKIDKAVAEDRTGALWVRADGAICVGNECITLKKSADGAMDFTLDPDKCGCEERDALLDAFADCVITGQGINLAIKPRTRQD
jgi:hypothetical protein